MRTYSVELETSTTEVAGVSKSTALSNLRGRIADLVSGGAGPRLKNYVAYTVIPYIISLYITRSHAFSVQVVMVSVSGRIASSLSSLFHFSHSIVKRAWTSLVLPTLVVGLLTGNVDLVKMFVINGLSTIATG